MPIKDLAFARYTAIVDKGPQISALVKQREPGFDWGFDLNVAFEQLSVFARHIDSAAPIARLPVFALARFQVDDETRDSLLRDDKPLPDFPVFPLGVIGTDHVGYGSFDLLPLKRLDVMQSLKNALSAANLIGGTVPRVTVRLAALLVYPFKDPALEYDALIEGDRGPLTIVLRMDIDGAMLVGREPWPAMPAMQTPGIDDWRMSPGSFSMAGALLIGEDGCETLLPSNLATRMVRFRQLVRTRHESKATFGRGEHPTVPGFNGKIRLGFSVQFACEWFPLGHSLGQISYSLPLAPGEKLKIAVIDWSRRDAAKRNEQTTEQEDLDHAATRDRSLSEAVHMVVTENQSGSSFMAGGALSAGAGIPIGPVSLGVGGAFSAGGSSAETRGMREVVGDTTQQISDAFHQASSAMRELNSTVVVQGEQAEKAEARTRIVANYNHSHALTILYYEVLQHYRLVTKPGSVRPVLFMKYEAFSFDFLDEDTAYDLIDLHRQAIEASLLDESVRACLQVVVKRACLKHNFELEKKKREEQGDPLDNQLLGAVTLVMNTGGVGPVQNVAVNIVLKSGQPIQCRFTDETLTAYLAGYGGQGYSSPAQYFPTVMANAYWPRPDAPGLQHPWIKPNSEFICSVEPLTPIRWNNIGAIEVGQTRSPGTDVAVEGGRADTRPWVLAELTATTQNGPTTWTMHEGAASPNKIAWDSFLRLGVEGFTAPVTSVDDLLSADEKCCLRRLLLHLNKHRGHYWRAIWLAENAHDRAVRLDGWMLGNDPLDDVVDNDLIEFEGEYAVMPINPGAEELLARLFRVENLAKAEIYNEFVEQMLTLPARGVFAEAKLGHCNASELIDDTRFWDWQKSPIPDDAPAIQAVSTDSRYQDLTEALKATPFPAAMVNIVNPQGLPDPAGLGAASSVLNSLGAFKDLSGLKELGPLLQTLSNNATQLASQGLKNAQTPALINAIRSAKELPDDKKADLIGKLLGNQVSPPAPAAAPTPAGAGQTPPTGAQSQPPQGQGAQGQAQQPPPPPTPAPKPAPAPAPTPKPIPAPRPQRSPTLSNKSKLIVVTFAFDINDMMLGKWQVKLLSGGEISPVETRMINDLAGVSGVDIGNRMELWLPESFGGTSGVTVQIHGQIIGLPQVLAAGTKTYEIKTWSEPRDFTTDIARAVWDKTTILRVIQATEPVGYVLQRSISDTEAKTEVTSRTGSIEVGVENSVEIEGGIPGVAEGKEAVKITAKGTYGVTASTSGLVQATNGYQETIAFNGYRIKPSAPTITPV